MYTRRFSSKRSTLPHLNTPDLAGAGRSFGLLSGNGLGNFAMEKKQQKYQLTTTIAKAKFYEKITRELSRQKWFRSAFVSGWYRRRYVLHVRELCRLDKIENSIHGLLARQD
jgi:hypothetical protein